MKKLLTIILGLVSYSAIAQVNCPDISGGFLCYDEESELEYELTVKRNLNEDGFYEYITIDDVGENTTVADGIEREDEYGYKLKLNCSEDGKSLIFQSIGTFIDEGGKEIEEKYESISHLNKEESLQEDVSIYADGRLSEEYSSICRKNI